MTHDKIIQSVNFLVPNATFSISGDAYDAIEWHDERPQPSWQEIQDALPEAEKHQWRKSASLSRRQFKVGEALYEVNGTPLVEQIEALLAGLPEPDKTIANISYNESNTFDRLDSFVVQFGQALGMTDEEVDDFFEWAEEEKWREE